MLELPFETIVPLFSPAVDYAWGAWGDWSTCNGVCGGSPGKISRQRSCTPPSNGGANCPSTGNIDQMDCTTGDCGSNLKVL